MNSYTMPKSLSSEPLALTSHGPGLFEIRTLEMEYFRTRPNRPEQTFEIIWLIKGRLQIMFDLETYEVSGGMIIFLAPGQAFHVRSAIDPDGIVLNFPVGLMTAGLDSPYPNLTYGCSRLFDVDTNSVTSLMSVIQCMRGELVSPDTRKTEVLSGYLKIFLIYLFRQRAVVFRSSLKADMGMLAKRFFDLLERRYHINKKVSDYADELAVTPNYLNQIIKQETGMSASANIRKRLLLQAKRMALIQGISMKTVAYKLGFDDTAHFSKFFKMGCGCNFTTYRKTGTD